VVHALRRHKLKYGMVTMCVGMGRAPPASSRASEAMTTLLQPVGWTEAQLAVPGSDARLALRHCQPADMPVRGRCWRRPWACHKPFMRRLPNGWPHAVWP
jgi:hypothetical protein